MAGRTMTYHEGTDGMLYPDLTTPEETVGMTNLGRFAFRAMEYLKENHNGRYRALLRLGKLAETMKEVEDTADRMMEGLEESYLKNHPPKDRHSTMEMWRLRQQARMQAEEIVMSEVVLRFH